MKLLPHWIAWIIVGTAASVFLGFLIYPAIAQIGVLKFMLDTLYVLGGVGGIVLFVWALISLDSDLDDRE